MAPSSFSAVSKKRSLEMVVYDPAAAAAANKRARDDDEETSISSASASASTSTSPTATALFQLAASAEPPPPFGDLEPISAVPISAVPPQLPPRPWPRPRSPVAGREEPPCLRKHFLLELGLRADLPLHFIADKCLTATDLDPHQNRLRIPRNGAIQRLRPLLTTAELHDANLFYLPDPAPKPKRRSGKQKQQQQQQPAAEAGPRNDGGSSASSSAAAAETSKQKIKKPKAKGTVHGGLRVRLVNLDAGAKELLLTRWKSSRGTIVKGEGYLDFIRRCGFKAKDAVEVWAFVQRRFRIFGKDIYGDSLLHVLIVKKDDDEQPQRCRYCRHPPAPVVNVDPSTIMSSS